ncbi:MAG TPA: hypothetical protein VF194_10840 [Ferrovibrio sp.]|jgi:hypothetical protein|uniref:hypothetical protein n=1 Tax=Ferrovibrio sp. TaxID=1917215 RepID=UPI002ED59CF3
MTPFTLPANVHALIREAYDYWQRIHPAAGPPERLPGRQHIDPLDIAPPLLPHVWLVDVLRDAAAEPALRFRYRLVGSAVDRGSGRTLTGRWLDEVNAGFFRDPLLCGPYLSVASTRQPDYRVGTPLFAHAQQWSWLERLMMPLAQNGQDVDMLFCCTVFYDVEGKVMGSRL